MGWQGIKWHHNDILLSLPALNWCCGGFIAPYWSKMRYLAPKHLDYSQGFIKLLHEIGGHTMGWKGRKCYTNDILHSLPELNWCCWGFIAPFWSKMGYLAPKHLNYSHGFKTDSMQFEGIPWLVGKSPLVLRSRWANRVTAALRCHWQSRPILPRGQHLGTVH